jgi:hypothetical protein
MCSTEISFSINRKYENLDELTDYKYSKTPKLRRKIKSILKDYDPTDSDYEYNKYKTNKLGVKSPDRSYYSFLNTLKKNEIQKSTSSELFKKKRDSKKEKCTRNFKTQKNNNLGFNFLDLINENIKKNQEINNNQNDPPSFTQFLQNFMENENVKNSKEFLEEKEELNQKMEKMKTIKKHSQMTVNHLYNNIG